MSRLVWIAGQIKHADCVMDIGSDHAYLAVKLLNAKKAKHVINIEINEKPMNTGIYILKKNNLLEDTENIINDGLKDLEFNRTIDYCVIAGMGSHTIVDILEHDDEHIKSFIVQPNNKVDLVRTWIKDQNYFIKNETVIVERNIFYNIIVIDKVVGTPVVTAEDILLGPINRTKKEPVFLQMINEKYHQLNTLDLTLVKEEVRQEYEIIKAVLKEAKDEAKEY